MAVGCGLVASLAVTVRVETAPRSPAPEHGQSHTDTQDIDALRRAAERGDADAQYALADAYSNFRVESMEDAEALAVRWYRLAANQGHAEAQLHLGLRHEGVSRRTAAKRFDGIASRRAKKAPARSSTSG